MVDDLPMVPLVTSRELDALECYMGDVLTELLQQDAVADTFSETAPALCPPLPSPEDAA